MGQVFTTKRTREEREAYFAGFRAGLTADRDFFTDEFVVAMEDIIAKLYDYDEKDEHTYNNSEV